MPLLMMRAEIMGLQNLIIKEKPTENVAEHQSCKTISGQDDLLYLDEKKTIGTGTGRP